MLLTIDRDIDKGSYLIEWCWVNYFFNIAAASYQMGLFQVMPDCSISYNKFFKNIKVVLQMELNWVTVLCETRFIQPAAISRRDSEESTNSSSPDIVSDNVCVGVWGVWVCVFCFVFSPIFKDASSKFSKFSSLFHLKNHSKYIYFEFRSKLLSRLN